MRQLVGYILADFARFFSEVGHQFIHTAEWCFDYDGRHGCPNCIKETK